MRVLWIVVLVVAAGVAQAQSSAGWQGEWGSFSGGPRGTFQRISVSGCAGTSCQFFLVSRQGSENSGTAEKLTLTLQSDSTARVELPAEGDGNMCVLQFVRQGGGTPSLRVTATGASCTSFYSTSRKVSMNGVYPLRSTMNFAGTNAEACFQEPTGARLATCTHPEVAALEDKWAEMMDEYPLQKPARGQNVGDLEQQADDEILKACDAAADPARCLTGWYTAEIGYMQVAKGMFVHGTVERGDAAVGGRLAARIEGRYRKSFANGDVEGDHYRTTDTLTIRKVGAASIHFDAELNFYNGHTCSLAGGALYRADGSFVFDDASANADAPGMPACRLAIVPTATGVTFKDLNGSCKSYCGERGSWTGAEFRFADRVPELKTRP